MVESDIPIFADMNVASFVKLKKLLYALAQSVPFKPNYAKLARDLEIDGRTFEVGGKNKTQRQIRQAAEGYVVKDDIEYAFQNVIPLWMFGFIY